MAPQDARRALGAVLFEAGPQAESGELSIEWNILVTEGLALLRSVTASEAHAGALPDVNPDGLAVGGQFEIDAPALAYLRPGTETGRFVIARPEAKDISRLAGDDSGRIMFAADTKFRVTKITPGLSGGQPVIHLEHPGPESVTAAGGSSAAVGGFSAAAGGFSAAAGLSSAAAAETQIPRLGPLPAGWAWLDEGRGLAIPVRRPESQEALALSGWRAAVRAPGPAYAFHRDTGLVVLQDRRVIELTDGWIRLPDGLLHRDRGFVISPDGALSVSGVPREARMGLRDAQMDADDLGLWLGRHRVVDDPELAPGWAERADDSRSPLWRWNAEPGVIPVAIPPGLTRGPASGQNLRCLLHTLSQLTQRTLRDEVQRQQVTTDGLANWLERAMPEGTEGYQQLLNRLMINVTDVLPTFTEAFGVRVQVFEFRRTGDTTANGTFRFAHDGIYVHAPHGPERDQAGYPTPILHVHWSYSHFEPLFTARYPVQLVLRRPLRDAGRGVPVGAVLPAPGQFQQIIGGISVLLQDHPDRAGFLADHPGFEQQVSDLDQRRQTLYAQLGTAYDLVRAQHLRAILATLNDLRDQLVASSHRSQGVGFGLEEAGLEESVVPTPSGFYLRAEGAAGVQDGPEDRVAARAFAPVAGAVVVHVHTDPASGRLVVGGRLLTVEEFNAEVLPHLGLASRRVLVLVACQAGRGTARRAGRAGPRAGRAERPAGASASGRCLHHPGRRGTGQGAGCRRGRPPHAQRAAGGLAAVPAGRGSPAGAGFRPGGSAGGPQRDAACWCAGSRGWPACAAPAVARPRDQMAYGSVGGRWRSAKETWPAAGEANHQLEPCWVRSAPGLCP